MILCTTTVILQPESEHGEETLGQESGQLEGPIFDSIHHYEVPGIAVQDDPVYGLQSMAL
jgi:hypothetical protein